MTIAFDPGKRDRTVAERDLDFADAAIVFGGVTFDRADERKDYGEPRLVTIGTLQGRMVAVCWTPRGDARHVFSVRKANDREQARFRHFLDR